MIVAVVFAFELVTGDSFAAGTHREVVGPDLALRSDLRW